ncbi:MAG: MraY family glycosyltransferase [Planctomycetota bacterium]|nr:MraY family glycosyltransferase [Planctomycetota bacterium]
MQHLPAAVANETPLGPSEVLSPFMGVFFVAFAVSFIATPIMRRLALVNGVVDWPDHKRKAHLEPIAYLGGVAIFLGWLAGVFLCYFIAPAGGGSLDHTSFPMSIIIGASVIHLTGLIDDVYGVSPRVKIGGQLIGAAAVAYRSDLGPRLVNDFLHAVSLSAPPWLSYTLGAVLIAVAVVGACNSLNLLDGLDGLAAGVSGISAAGFLFIALFAAGAVVDTGAGSAIDAIIANPVRIGMCLAVLGAVLGFLPYNFNPANIFMGDAGSLLLGYLCIVTILLFASVPANTPLNGPLLVMAALIVFALPITDTSLAIVRRKLRGQPIFSPDNQHIHHQLIRSGLTVRRAVFAMYAMAFAFGILGCSLIYLRWRYVLAAFMVLFSFILVTAYKIGHRNLLLAQIAAKEKEAAAAGTTLAPSGPAPVPTHQPAADNAPPTAAPQAVLNAATDTKA